MGWMTQISNPSRGNKIYLLQNVQNSSGGPPGLLFNGYWGS